MNEVLLYFALKYKGNWDEVYNALDRKEKISIEELEDVEKRINCNYITILSKEYPESLKSIYKPPFVLFYYGNINLLSKKETLAVVGSRTNSDFGEVITRKLVSDMVKKDYLIVSGMASGIDSIAHKTAIDYNGSTIAILGSGIDYCYPEENLELYSLLKKNQLVMSEYPNDQAPEKDNFKVRNRIIAGLSKAVLVTEAKKKSGSMNTVTYALNEGREIFCVPNAMDADSGCNLLIKQGAKLVENSDDIINNI